MTAHSHDDLSWMPTLDAFLQSDDEMAVPVPRMRRSPPNTESETILANPPLAVPLEVPAVEVPQPKPRSSKAKAQERAARKRIREKERREQVNFAFKKLNALMMEADSTYKPNAPFASTFTPANAGINQPYLISKTTTKISDLHSDNAKKEVQIKELMDEIARKKLGEPSSPPHEYEGPSVEKTEEQKRQVQMMMVPMMISPDWMMNMMKVMADTNPGAKKRKIVEEPQHAPATSGNVAHCA